MDAEALNLQALGLTLLQQGQSALAVEKFREALRLATDDAALWTHFAVALTGCHRYSEALIAARHSVSLRPDSIHAYNALANVLSAKGKPLEAADLYRRALALEPIAGLWNNLANVLKSAGHLEEAVAAYRRALELDPQLWRSYSNLLLTLNYLPRQTPEALAAAHRAFGKAIEAAIPPAPAGMQAGPLSRPLRVGFISADFYYHPVGRLFLPVLSAHDRARQTWLLYSHCKVNDSVTREIEAAADIWRDISALDDDALEALMRTDAVDVLIDLSGHTATNRLPFFARHVVPVQAAWMGYAGTSGMSRMDWLLADAITIPMAEESLYSEHILRIPAPYIVLTRPEPAVPVGATPALVNGHITFASFNNTAKLTDEVLATWADILRALPNSRLVMKNKAFAEAEMREIYRTRLARLGIAGERVDFEGESAGEAYYQCFNGIDIALDPFPFPGLLTTLDTLWMGVPTVTMRGRGGMIGHHGELLLSMVGLSQWVASDRDEYIRIAVGLASDLIGLSRWRACLRAMLEESAIFDAARLARELELAFEHIFAWAAARNEGEMNG